MARRPWVTVYVTASIDGRIATREGDSRLSCPYDLRRLHAVRAASDAVMVGANTVIRDDPLLTVRLVEGGNPLRIVVDGALRTPLDSRIYTMDPSMTLVLASRKASRDKMDILRKKGVQVLVVEDSGGRIIMSRALGKLWKLGIRRLLVEGGGELIWSLAEDGLIDELRVTVAPLLLGGHEATPMVGGKGFGRIEEALHLYLYSAALCECGREVHLIYRKR